MCVLGPAQPFPVGQVFSQSVLPTDTVSQDPIISSCGLKGSCGPILLLLLASGQLVLGQCVFWSYLPSPVPSAPLCPPNPFSASAAPSPDPRQTPQPPGTQATCCYLQGLGTVEGCLEQHLVASLRGGPSSGATIS